MNLPAIDRDAACVHELRQIDALLKSGRASAALERSHLLFADDRTPASRAGDLCRLTALAAQQLNLLPMAEAMWREAVARAGSPSDAADAWVNLGVMLARQQRHAEAADCCRAALEIDPDHAIALANLALLLADTGRFAEAESLHRRALALDPTNAATHTHLGVLLATTNRLAEAERCHRRALELRPHDASAHTNLGLVLQQLERLAEAEQHQRRALELAPQGAAIHSNLGNLLARRGREEEAEHRLRDALALDPDWAAAHCNLAVLLTDQGRDDDARMHFRRALALRPGYPLARLDLSCLLLAQGEFEEGWRLHEARHDPQLPDNGIPPPNVDIPMWRGEPLAGRSLLIWPEQGLGDQIQFCRYAPQLKALGAARITLVCQKPLHALFGTLPRVDAVLAADVVDNAFHVAPAELGTHDFWTFPLSLPALLHTDLSSLPHAPIPYLRAEPSRAAAWADRLRADASTGSGLRVGLVWRGNPRHNNDAERSLAGPATLAALWSVPGVRFVSLQTGRAAAQAGALPPDLPLLHVGGELHDFADTAAALGALDLLICVDTSIAHLAGAMGKPCWVLLPQRKTDWRWLRGREDSPWYPQGMRLFRQAVRGDWAPVVDRVRDALQHKARPRA